MAETMVAKPGKAQLKTPQHNSATTQKLVNGNGTTLFSFKINDDLSASAYASNWVLIGIIAIVIIAFILKAWNSRRYTSMEVDEAEFGIGSQKIKLKPNDVDTQIAYKIWVELSTRKIGLPVDLESDVISEVYDSWYQFFSVTRELIKEIPSSKLRRKETIDIVELSIDVLNKGIRPHLTSWQAKFRRWYENALSTADNLEKTPQDIQKGFPQYNELSTSLLSVNEKLIKYRMKMREMAFGNKTSARED